MLTIVALVLGVASLILHFVAPRTSTTVDDKALDIIDNVKDKLPK